MPQWSDNESAKKFDSRALQRLDSAIIPNRVNEIRCFSAVRNASLRLPFFLEYHRSIGVDRFFVISNNSTDDTNDILLNEPDVHLWHTSAEYSKSNFGNDWIFHLLLEHGINKWCLILDQDEQLIFPHFEKKSIKNLTNSLQSRGATGYTTVFLDMYSKNNLNDLHYQQGQPFLGTCPYFDFPDDVLSKLCLDLFRFIPRYRLLKPILDFYISRRTSRYRVFKVPALIRKFPLFFFKPDIIISSGLHNAKNISLSNARGAILHFKYLQDFHSYVAEEIERSQHANCASEYKSYLSTMDTNNVTFYTKESLLFTGTDQLLEKRIFVE